MELVTILELPTRMESSFRAGSRHLGSIDSECANRCLRWPHWPRKEMVTTTITGTNIEQRVRERSVQRPCAGGSRIWQWLHRMSYVSGQMLGYGLGFLLGGTHMFVTNASNPETLTRHQSSTRWAGGTTQAEDKPGGKLHRKKKAKNNKKRTGYLSLG